MRRIIPQYDFFKKKYGSELLIDVVELKYVKLFLTAKPIHSLTYYDITFITEGKGKFSVDNQHHKVSPQDVVFSRPGEIRNWDTFGIGDGYALIFEEEFLSSFFKDPLFVQHLSFFQMNKASEKLRLSDELYERMIRLLEEIKAEIDTYHQDDVHVLRALLYEILMLLDRAYQSMMETQPENSKKDAGSIHINKFTELVVAHLKEQHSVQFYADQLCISSVYLNEIVNSFLGTTAKQYIHSKIMDEARRLLTYTDHSVSDIALELHFSSASYFALCFKAYTGKTPQMYRNTHKP